MVRTLGNAIARGRLAQAWLLTGVRGVGKTSTARIIARALNCIGPDGQGGPTITPCGQCEPCVAIAAGSHIDVVEMDAASNTGVDDVREIIEAVRYATVSARYKIYIIDEVHMLSRNAFNALLKTLEEPPPHVKFIFATTEVNKVPVTILSRCQRFDLRRVPQDVLEAHFARIAEAEQVAAEPAALALIARAAEGSVRDGLSLLDQAIAHGAGAVTADLVRDMLGLADHGAVRALFAQVLAGEAGAALDAISRLYGLGLDPEQLLRELLALVHTLTRQRIRPNPDPALSAADQAEMASWAEQLSFQRLHQLWQLLLKGLADVQAAPVPVQAAEMAILRLIHALELPDPGMLARLLQDGASAPTVTGLPGAPAPASAPVLSMPLAPTAASAAPDFAALVALFRQNREPRLANLLHDQLRLVSLAPGQLVLAATDVDKDVPLALARCLTEWTGSKWQVEVRAQGGGMTLLEAEQAAQAALVAEARAHPIVAALTEHYPDADLKVTKIHAQS